MQVVIQIFSLPLVKFSVIKSMIGTCMQRKNLLWICDRSKKKKKKASRCWWGPKISHKNTKDKFRHGINNQDLWCPIDFDYSAQAV